MFFHADDDQQRALTVSRKSERLINLTIALLATKRYLTKSEIFKTVEGYEGSAESKERMFERDKDDLRSLGIDIEVGSFDPLFNDEAGYRIKQENYQLDLGPITALEVSLLSLAAKAWQGAALNDAAQRVLVKLSSLGFPLDEATLPSSIPAISTSDFDITVVTRAIAQRQVLEFLYRNHDFSSDARRVVPIGLSTRSGFWYFTGVDQAIQEIRTFRFDRVLEAFTVHKGPKDFEVPEGFDASQVFESESAPIAIIDVRKGRCTSLRALASSIKSMGEWDQIQIPILDVRTLSALILWHGEDAYVHAPEELRIRIIESLKALVDIHG